MRKVCVLVSSDKCFSGEREDKSGKAIAEVVSSLGYQVDSLDIVPDEKDQIVDKFNEYINKNIPLVLTTGGTGFSKRDIMPEATKSVIDRDVPGIPEAMRAKSLEITDKAMLSRAIAGIKNNTLIINLPGSEKAVRESLDIIMGAVAHGLDILLGEASECGRK